MDQRKPKRSAGAANDRKAIVAYLSYAVKDVRALSKRSVYFLELSIAALTDEALPAPIRPLQPTGFH